MKIIDRKRVVTNQLQQGLEVHIEKPKKFVNKISTQKIKEPQVLK